MKRALVVIGCAIAGAALGVVALLLVARLAGARLSSPIVSAIAMPGAHVVSWVTGWPLHQESALACYTVGLIGTIGLADAIVGALVGAFVAGSRSSADRSEKRVRD